MDYELTLKVRNAPLLNEMKRAGLKTAADLHRATGIGQGVIGDFLNLKTTPYGRDGFTPKPSVLKLAEYFGLSYECLFPEANLRSPLVQNKFTQQVSSQQMAQLANISTEDPSRLLEIMETEDRDVLEDMLSGKVTPREKEVLKARANGKTLIEIGDSMGICSQRVRQIEQRALRRLRHPRNHEELIESAGVYAENFVDTVEVFKAKKDDGISEEAKKQTKVILEKSEATFS